MNIFALHQHPVVAAKQHCDKHVVKMILETAQLLSTAHRMLDGDETRYTFFEVTESGTKEVGYVLFYDECETDGLEWKKEEYFRDNP